MKICWTMAFATLVVLAAASAGFFVSGYSPVVGTANEATIPLDDVAGVYVKEHDGSFTSYIVGAPEFVNREFTSRYILSPTPESTATTTPEPTPEPGVGAQTIYGTGDEGTFITLTEGVYSITTTGTTPTVVTAEGVQWGCLVLVAASRPPDAIPAGYGPFDWLGGYVYWGDEQVGLQRGPSGTLRIGDGPDDDIRPGWGIIAGGEECGPWTITFEVQL